MEPELEEKIDIRLSRGELLVIFEFLARSYDVWKKSANDDVTSFLLVKPDDGERTALRRLEGAIESTLVEVFAANYHDLIRQAKDTLTAE